MTLNDGQLISGATSAESNTTFQALEAGSDTALEPNFHEASNQEVDRACEAAQSAFDDYRALPMETRARLLETIAERMDARVEDFVERTTRETGLAEGRIRNELGRTTGQLRLFAEVVRQGDFLGVRIDSEGGADVRQYHIPMGPVAVFAVSNFPLAFSVAGGDTASALAAGCPVVVKGHPAHPATSAITAEAILAALQELDVPAGVFSLIQGQTHAVGERLVRHPDIRAVGFTGSFQGGTALARIAAERAEPIPVFAEMGSINPVFLLPQALAESSKDIAEGFVGSLTMGAGQFCTNPGLVFAVRGDGLEAFVRTVGASVEEAEPGVMLHEGVFSGYEASLKRLDGLAGVNQVAAGKSAAKRAQTRLYRTTLETLQKQPETLEEVFGPTSLIVEVPDEAGLVQAAAAIPGQLTTTIHATAKELAAHKALIHTLELRAGRLLFGGYPTGVRVCHAMVHGGPYPATTSYGQTTSVGTRAIERFLRLVCYQDYPQELLPEPLRDSNPLKLRRLINGAWQS